jgi:chitinase
MIIKIVQQLRTQLNGVDATRPLSYAGASLIILTPEAMYIGDNDSSQWGWNSYVQVLHTVGDAVDFVQIMLYNDPRTKGDVATATAVYDIWAKGTPLAGNNWSHGYPSHKLVAALPACSDCAGSGFMKSNLAEAFVGNMMKSYAGQFGGVALWDWGGDKYHSGGNFSTMIATALGLNSGWCTGCVGGTAGPCKVSTVGVCCDKVNGVCPSGSEPCKQV